MATPSRRPDAPVEQLLFEEPYRFDFFQAVRLLEGLGPDRQPVGHDGPPGREAVRFVAQPSLGFPASPIHRLERADEADSPPVMTVPFLGLTGPMGVMPHVYTELLLDQGRDGEAMAAFLDLFNHRLISLFVRAHKKYRVAAPRGSDDANVRGPAGHLFDLIDLGSPAFRGRHEFPDSALLPYAGLLAQRHRSAVSLEGLLRDYFDLPVEVEQFAGRWQELDPADRLALGVLEGNNSLGLTTVLGDRVWDARGKIRLRVGPLTLDKFRSLIPDGPALRPLLQMVRLYVGVEFDLDVQLVLRAEEVPQCLLVGESTEGPQLGLAAWLRGASPLAADVDDAIFSSHF